MFFSCNCKYKLKLIIIKNQIYVKNKDTGDRRKISLDYNKYSIIVPPEQIEDITILKSEINNLFIPLNVKNIKIINSKINNVELNNGIYNFNKIYLIKNEIKINKKKLKNSDVVLKINEIITDIKNKKISNNDLFKIKINYYKYLEKENNNNVVKLISNIFN